jgi:biopolymer transport protein ExbB
MSQVKPSGNNKSGFNWTVLVIPIALVISILAFIFVFGDPANFVGPDKKDPIPNGGRYFLGLVYKGGFIVPILFTMLLTVITFSIERFLTIAKAKGTGSIETFLQTVKTSLANNDINGALAACSKQKGSVANVVQAGLHKYEEMKKNNELTNEQKVLNISKEIEEATSLELPSLEQNLPILATIASVATLVALLGTVLGMIRAFGAMATTGSPDPSVLAAGISEALINTAIGIGTSAIAIIMYNIFTSSIDKLTYAIDEIGFSIAQSFASTQK